MSKWKCLVPGGWSTLTSSCWGTLINSECVHLKLGAYESPWQPWTRGSHCTKCLVPLEQDNFIRSYGAVEHNVIKRRKTQVNVLIRHIFLWKWLELYWIQNWFLLWHRSKGENIFWITIKPIYGSILPILQKRFRIDREFNILSNGNNNAFSLCNLYPTWFVHLRLKFSFSKETWPSGQQHSSIVKVNNTLYNNFKFTALKLAHITHAHRQDSL